MVTTFTGRREQRAGWRRAGRQSSSRAEIADYCDDAQQNPRPEVPPLSSSLVDDTHFLIVLYHKIPGLSTAVTAHLDGTRLRAPCSCGSGLPCSPGGGQRRGSYHGEKRRLCAGSVAPRAASAAALAGRRLLLSGGCWVGKVLTAGMCRGYGPTSLAVPRPSFPG